MQTSVVDPLIGRTLEGRYRLQDRIARGGMSTVYAAVDERLDRLVAVKVMSSGLSADPAFSDRFAREARAAARLTHLNTVAVYDQGWEAAPDGHHVFLVMELVEGRTLRELLREKHRLSPAEAISVMEPVLSALAAAHRAGLVHRDVKPENILLSDDGVVKVADFGLARAVESEASHTRTGLMMGTVAYCAPEQFTSGIADKRSDVYACGIVLFELLTGQPPFRGDTAINVAYQHVNSRVPAPSSRVKGIPPEIDELVVMATDPDPDSRPADAAALLAEVADVREELDLPVVPVPPRPRNRARSLTKEPAAVSPDAMTTDVIRRAAGLSDGATSVVPPPGSVGGRALVRDDAPPPPVIIPPPRERRPRVRGRWRAVLIVMLLLLAGLGAGYGAWYYVAGRYSKVPNVAGESPARAVADLKHAGYSNVTVLPGPEFDDRPANQRVPKGAVLRTDPGAGSRVVKDGKITVVVSAGPHVFTVPNLKRMTPAQARDQLKRISDLIVVSDTLRPESADFIPAGLVTRTAPAAGSHITHDDTVVLYVSTGPPIITVPTIGTDTTVAQAVKILKRAGFTPQVGTAIYSDTVPKDNVISISPTGPQRKFSTITITPSKGPQLVTIPDIPRFTPLTAAEKQLTELGLKVEVQRAFGGYADLVVGLDPLPGTQVPVGYTVTVSVV